MVCMVRRWDTFSLNPEAHAQLCEPGGGGGGMARPTTQQNVCAFVRLCGVLAKYSIWHLTMAAVGTTTRHRDSPYRNKNKNTVQERSPLSSYASDLDEMSIPAVVSQDEEAPPTANSKKGGAEGLQQQFPNVSSPPGDSTLNNNVPASPLQRSPRSRHSIGAVFSVPAVKASVALASSPQRSNNVSKPPLGTSFAPSSSRRASPRKRKALLPPLAPTPSSLKAAAAAAASSGVKSTTTQPMPRPALLDTTPTPTPTLTITAETKTMTVAGNEEENPVTPTNSMQLKPLIGKTPLKNDGTPLEPKTSTRPVYDDDEDNDTLMAEEETGNDENNNGQELLPGVVTATAPTSPLANQTNKSPNRTSDTAPKRSSPLAPRQLQEENSTSPVSVVAVTGVVHQGLVQLDQLHKRMELLFPQLVAGKKASWMNCVAARLFACYSFHRDAVLIQQQSGKGSQQQQPSPRKRPRRKAQCSGKDVLLASLQPIRHMLSALVDLEIALLQDEPQTTTKAYGGDGRKQRVHFAAFDGSALQPPSDVMEDSHSHEQAAIDGLSQVLQAVEELKKEDGDSTSTTPASQELLRELVDYLEGPFLVDNHAPVCAQSLSTRFVEYAQPRVEKAAKRYANDLRQLLVVDEDSNNSSNKSRRRRRPLSWHCRLADAAAQLVRYWLRTKLNPVPDRAPFERYSDGWNTRVCDLVSMEAEADNGGITTAVDDGSLSSLVSNAASHICYYFGNDWQHWKCRVDATPTDFLAVSELCQTGIAPASLGTPSKKRRQSGPVLKEWSIQDWQQVGQQVELATGFLAAVNGAKFLYELLTIVVLYPEVEASWERTIQSSAERLGHCRGDEDDTAVQDSDVHLLLLRFSPTTLLQQLPILIHWTRKQACELFLQQQLPKKFLFGSDVKKTRRKRAYQPHVGLLEQRFEQAMSKVAFPVVHLAEGEDDDDEEEEEEE